MNSPAIPTYVSYGLAFPIGTIAPLASTSRVVFTIPPS